MRKLLPIIACIFLVSACENDIEIEDPAKAEIYELSKIEYFAKTEYEITYDTILIEEGTFSNSTSVIQSFVIGTPKASEISYFLINEPTSSFQKNDSLKISVPTSINGNTVFTGAPRWTYRESGEEVLNYDRSNSTEKIEISPNTKASAKQYARIQNLAANYKATYKEKNSGRLIVVEGTWEGTQVCELMSDIRLEEIK